MLQVVTLVVLNIRSERVELGPVIVGCVVGSTNTGDSRIDRSIS